jgi:amino acid transporter
MEIQRTSGATTGTAAGPTAPSALSTAATGPDALPPGLGAPDDALPRRLGFLAATGLVVGTIIGSGIFRVPASVAAAVGTPGAVALVWVLGGLISLCGALSLAELGAAFPRSGGVFVYLREAYGPLVAFLFGWTMLVLGPASVTGIALVFAEYVGRLVPLTPGGIRAVAAGALLCVSIAAYRSVQGVGALVSVASAAKIAAIAVLVVAAFALGDGATGSFGGGVPADSSAQWGGLGFALVAALWAYNGFQDMVSVAGEVRDPGRVLPRALMAGMAIVVVLYLAANAAYLYVLPYATLRASPLVASDAMVRVVGGAGAAAAAGMVIVSTFGALVALAFSTPRIFFAMANAGLLFSSLARVHPRFKTPHVAVVAHAVVALAAVWSSTFEQLAAAFVLGIFPFLALAAAGVLVLRRTRPALSRPYRTPGYPLVPLVFIAGVLWVVGSALVAEPVPTLTGIGLTALGVPIYFVWRRMDRPSIDSSAQLAADDAAPVADHHGRGS